MKKILSLLCILGIATVALFVGCNKQERDESMLEDSFVSQFYSGDVLVTIARGAAISTRTSSNIEYYTITGQLNTTEYSLFVESETNKDGLTINNVYSQCGTWLFTEAIFEGRLISREFAELEDDGEETVAETRGSRRPNETYGACVRRVHASIKEAAEENNPILCEFVSCGAIAAAVAIVDCNEYGNQF